MALASGSGNNMYQGMTAMENMFRKGFFLLALALFLAWPGSAAWAGGSFAFEDLQPILNQQPVLSQWLTASLDFDQTGLAVRLGQNVYPHLGGARVGPYAILAKPKGKAGPFTLQVTVNTKIIFLDKAGKPMADSDKSEPWHIKEKLSSVTVEPSGGDLRVDF